MSNNKLWTTDEILELYQLGLIELLWQAQNIHRTYHSSNTIQLSTLLSIKTGGCPEDCAYCPQSKHHATGVNNEPLLSLEQVLGAAKRAKAQGAQRFCMGAAWRSPTEKQLDHVIEMVQAVKDLGLETCVTLGMLKENQAQRLKEAGLDYYNHNLDSSAEFYAEIITTRNYEDRLRTLEQVSAAGLKSCVGGIIGLGETSHQRAQLIATLANLDPVPDSVPINQLVATAGTPLAQQQKLSPFELVRTIAVARIAMPQATIRLSAGRDDLNPQAQTLCFLAGANSIFYGDSLLTTPNPQEKDDLDLLAELGLTPQPHEA